MDINVKDFCYLYIEPNEEMRIWNDIQEEDVFIGSFAEARQSEYADCEVMSFGIEGSGNNKYICVNISI